MVAVGTYKSSYSERTYGYSIVFDNLGSGKAYPATGNGTTTSNSGFLSLSKESIQITMPGIKLTNNSVPVTVVDKAYILDKVFLTLSNLTLFSLSLEYK
jgi:hypothetical protein